MKNLIAIALLAFTFNVGATTLNQTTSPRLDAEFVDLGVTHLDLATGLEWLDFGTLIDGTHEAVTFGHSIDTAVAAYGPQDFRLATETEVTNLFTFFFTDFVDEGNGTMAVLDGEPGYDTLSAERNSWFFSFGSYIYDATGDLSSMGLYLADDLTVQEAGIDLLTNPLASNIYNEDFRKWTTGTDERFADRGVFMVRDYSVVPVPAAVWLFGSGLLGLVAVARRKA